MKLKKQPSQHIIREIDYSTVDDTVLRPWIHQTDHDGDVRDKMLQLEQAAVLSKPYASYLGNSDIDKKPYEVVELRRLLSKNSWLQDKDDDIHPEHHDDDIISSHHDDDIISSHHADDIKPSLSPSSSYDHNKKISPSSYMNDKTSLVNDKDLLKFINKQYNHKQEVLPKPVKPSSSSSSIKVSITKKNKKPSSLSSKHHHHMTADHILQPTESSSHHILPHHKPVATNQLSSSSSSSSAHHMMDFLQHERQRRQSLLQPVHASSSSSSSSRPKSASTIKPSSMKPSSSSYMKKTSSHDNNDDDHKPRNKSMSGYSNLTLSSYDGKSSHDPHTSSSRPSTSSSRYDDHHATSSLARVSINGLTSPILSSSSHHADPILFLSHRRKDMKSLHDHYMTTNGVYSLLHHPDHNHDVHHRNDEMMNFSRQVSSAVREKNRVDHVWGVLTTPGFMQAVGADKVFRSDQQINYTDKHEQAKQINQKYGRDHNIPTNAQAVYSDWVESAAHCGQKLFTASGPTMKK